jgi:tetratricopeptide (TPR) repeat protein
MLPLIILGLAAPAAVPVSASDPEAADRRSLARLEEAIRSRPDDPRLQLVLGDFYEGAGRIVEALAVFEKARGMSPKLPEAVLRSAQMRARMGDSGNAIPLFQAAIAQGELPLRLAARAGLSDLLYQANRFGEAATLLKESLADGDRSAEAFFLLGKALDRQAAALMPAEGEARKRLEEEASGALREALRLDPSHAPAHYVLGMHLVRLGRSAEARSELEAFRAAKSKQTAMEVSGRRRREDLPELRTMLDLARAHLEVGSSAAALKTVQEALGLFPDQLEAQFLLAQVQLRSGRFDDAARTYQEILRGNPGHPEALLALGGLRLRAGSKEEAAALALRAAEARRVFPEAYELLATLALEEGILRERTEEFARLALEQRPSPRNYVRLALALHAWGKIEECRSVVREGLARYPGNRDLLEGQGIVGGGGR